MQDENGEADRGSLFSLPGRSNKEGFLLFMPSNLKARFIKKLLKKDFPFFL